MPAAPEPVAYEAEQLPKIPFWLKLKAWWDGYELVIQPKSAGDNGSIRDGGQAGQQEYEPFVRWGESHLALLQAVWGEGLISPGDPIYLLHMIKPFGLNPAMSLLHLGAGLGGISRLMAEESGVWVTAFEEQRPLAELGMELSTMAGLGKRAPVQVYDPENLELKLKSFDCVFAKDCFFTVTDKERLFVVLDNALKDHGQLLFTDYVVTDAGRDSDAVKEWIDQDPVKPRFWSVEEYKRILTARKLDLRIAEDISEDYRQKIVAAWTSYMSGSGGEAVNSRTGSALVDEVELWTRRVRALESGEIQVYRFHAIKKPRESMLSDW